VSKFKPAVLQKISILLRRIVFSAKNLHTQTRPFSATKTTTTDPMERRIALYDNTLKKKNDNNNFENVSNEQQNSLSSRIRISLV